MIVELKLLEKQENEWCKRVKLNYYSAKSRNKNIQKSNNVGTKFTQLCVLL